MRFASDNIAVDPAPFVRRLGILMSKLFAIDWEGVFVPTYSIAEIILRGTLMYLALFLLMRFVLRREPGKLGIADMLLIVLIADAASNGMSATYNSVTEGILLVATLIFWNYALDWLGYHFPAFHAFIEAEPLLLVKDGKLNKRNMRQEMITEDELKAQLRLNGINDLADVEEARMEGDGNISVKKREVAKQ
jgi:uncharacterized membrane protein YcaP (DUF421 family)